MRPSRVWEGSLAFLGCVSLEIERLDASDPRSPAVFGRGAARIDRVDAMRVIKSTLLAVKAVVGILCFVLVALVGFIFSFGLSFAVGLYLDARQVLYPSKSVLMLLAFGSGLLLTSVVCLVIRRKVGPWKATDDLTTWVRLKAVGQLHPARMRYKRSAKRVALWLPSLIAGTVLFFFPVATHLIHPSSRYVRHYRIPIPWTFTTASSPGPPSDYSFVDVFAATTGRGRFGMTPFLLPIDWGEPEPVALMIFGAEPDGKAANRRLDRARSRAAKDPTIREFNLGGVSIACLQYQPQPRYRSYL